MNTNGRLAVLEVHFTPLCPTCRAWPVVVNLFPKLGEEPISPYLARCPACGRRGPLVLVFGIRPNSPQ